MTVGTSAALWLSDTLVHCLSPVSAVAEYSSLLHAGAEPVDTYVVVAAAGEALDLGAVATEGAQLTFTQPAVVALAQGFPANSSVRLTGGGFSNGRGAVYCYYPSLALTVDGVVESDASAVSAAPALQTTHRRLCK